MAVRILFPDAIPILPRQVNPNVKAFLSIHKDVFSTYTFKNVDLNLVEQLVVVDTNKWERLEGMSDLKTRSDLDIQLWDHHPIRGNIITPSKVCEVVGATITLLLRRIKQEQIKLSPIGGRTQFNCPIVVQSIDCLLGILEQFVVFFLQQRR